jgi:tryptophanyl-tRNA synthetase
MNRIFSGMRPSGKLHLGNYIGAIKNWIDLQNDAELAIFSVVDLHGITTPYEPATFQTQVYDVILDYLAAGIDPKKSLLVRQSRIPQHTQLMWLLSTITPVGWLERLPNWREKVDQVNAMGDRGASYQNNLGLLSYPVLMAADILLYKANLVPVGEDQVVHIELANEVGSKFNHLFPGRTGGDMFPRIKPHLATGARIMSLQDPTKKMSKTGDDGIALTDDADTVRGKIKRAVTDSDSEVRFDEATKPAISNLLTLFSTLTGSTIADLESRYSGATYSAFKNDLADAVVAFLEPMQARRAELAADPARLEQILTESEEKARTIASNNLDEALGRMGLR